MVTTRILITGTRIMTLISLFGLTKMVGTWRPRDVLNPKTPRATSGARRTMVRCPPTSWRRSRTLSLCTLTQLLVNGVTGIRLYLLYVSCLSSRRLRAMLLLLCPCRTRRSATVIRRLRCAMCRLLTRPIYRLRSKVTGLLPCSIMTRLRRTRCTAVRLYPTRCAMTLRTSLRTCPCYATRTVCSRRPTLLTCTRMTALKRGRTRCVVSRPT